MTSDDALVAAGRGAPIDGGNEVARTAASVRRSVARHPGAFVLVAAVAGFGLGVVARVWMRWISVDPEFTWSGTLAILAGFTVFATAQAAAAVARIRSSRPALTAAVRTAAAVLSAGLFGAAGAMMLPTVVFGSLACWRPGMRPITRALLALMALPSVAYVVIEIAGDNGWSPATVAQLLVFVWIYVAIVAATWPTTAPLPDGWRPSRSTVGIVIGAVVAFLVVALYLGGVQ